VLPKESFWAPARLTMIYVSEPVKQLGFQRRQKGKTRIAHAYALNVRIPVNPAQAGIQEVATIDASMDPGLRRDDGWWSLSKCLSGKTRIALA